MIELKEAISTHTGTSSPDVNEYRQRMKDQLAALDSLENPRRPECEKDFLEIERIRRDLSSLDCFAFNTSHPEQDRVTRLESEYCKLVSQYNKRRELPHGVDRSIGRYLLYGKRFNDIRTTTAWLEARDRGLLRKVVRPDDGRVVFYVVGLRCKLGDNVFTVDRRGREHRQYGRSVGRQAIAIVQTLPFEADQRDAFAQTIPDLDPTFHEVSIGDYKGCIRPISMTRKEVNAIFSAFQASPHETNPVIVPQPPASVPVDVSALMVAPEPATGDLFGQAVLH